MTARLLIILLFFPVLIYGQNDTSDNKIVIRGEPTYTPNPELIMVINKLNFRLDSISIKKINPKWINKIEVIKNEKSINIHGNKDGVVFIYPKNRYRTKILRLLGS